MTYLLTYIYKYILIFLIVNRGFTKSVQGNPDEARAARYVLKDYTSVTIKN